MQSVSWNVGAGLLALTLRELILVEITLPCAQETMRQFYQYIQGY